MCSFCIVLFCFEGSCSCWLALELSSHREFFTLQWDLCIFPCSSWRRSVRAPIFMLFKFTLLISSKFHSCIYHEFLSSVSLFLFKSQTLPDESGIDRSGLDLYFLDRQGENFKATVFYQPYFFLDIPDSRRHMEMTQHLQKRFEGCVVEVVEKEDLEMPNHLTGKRHKFHKISFNTMAELMDAKQQLW